MYLTTEYLKVPHEFLDFTGNLTHVFPNGDGGRGYFNVFASDIRGGSTWSRDGKPTGDLKILRDFSTGCYIEKIFDMKNQEIEADYGEHWYTARYLESVINAIERVFSRVGHLASLYRNGLAVYPESEPMPEEAQAIIAEELQGRVKAYYPRLESLKNLIKEQRKSNERK